MYKHALLVVILIPMIIPALAIGHAPEIPANFQPSYLNELMPNATQQFLMKDSYGKEVLSFTSVYNFDVSSYNGEENTGLVIGFDAPQLGSFVNRIEFETMTWRWWAYCSGGKEYDYELNTSFYISSGISGYYHHGSGSHSIYATDMPSLGYIGGSMTFVNFTVHTLFGSVLYDEEALTIGVNFTRQEDGWVVSTFSNASSIFTSGESVIEYVVNTQLPIPQWFDILPYAFGIGAVILLLGILRIVVIEVRRSDSLE